MRANTLILFTLLAGTWLYGQPGPKKPSLPNIVFILADDLGYGELGCYGQQQIETPNLDKLAAGGMKLTNFYSGSAVCAPARCALLTGRHMGHSYIRGNDEWGERGEVWNFAKAVQDPNLEGQRPIPDSILTLAEILKKRGYTTACVGKWGLGAPLSEGRPNAQGFDFFYGYNCQRQAHTLYPPFQWRNEEKVWLDNKLVVPNTKLAAEADPNKIESYADFALTNYAPEFQMEEAARFMEEHASRPFFLYFASPLPHLPLQAPQRWVDYYHEKLGEEAPYTGDKGYFPSRYPNATYAAMISYLDEQVGAILAKLEELGLDKNTLVVFTSDNGPSYTGGMDPLYFNSAQPFHGEYGRGKGFLYEGGIRVPMIAWWPGKIKPGSQSDFPAALWDMLPTFSKLTKGALPGNPDGVDLMPVWTQKGKLPRRDYLYWEFPEYGGQQAVRMGKWKAIRTDMQKGNLVTQLYDLETDPREEKDVAKDNPLVVKQIEAIMSKEHMPSQIERFHIKALDEK